MSARAHPSAARTLAVLLALVAALGLMGLIDLFTLLGWVDQQYVWAVPLAASWGALFTFFVAGGCLWVALFPADPWPALVQLGISALALAVSAGAGLDWRPLALAVGVAGSALALWQLLGRPPAELGGRPSVRRAVLVVALLGSLLWLPYASVAFERSRAGVLGSVTQGIEHWPVQGAVAVALVLGALVLAVWEDGRPSLRVAVSLSAVWIGMAELAHPDRAGAVGSLLWGVGVTLWGLLVALTAVPVPGRHTPGAPSVIQARARPSHEETTMKTMTCRQLGGPCDLALSGTTADDVINAQDRHLREAVRAGDAAHVPAHEDMKGRWRHPVRAMGWYRDTKRAFAELADA